MQLVDRLWRFGSALFATNRAVPRSNGLDGGDSEFPAVWLARGSRSYALAMIPLLRTFTSIQRGVRKVFSRL